MFNVGVTGTGSLIGQGIIKSIQRSEFANEYKLVGFDYFDNTVGSYWCSSNYILPDILSNNVTENEWLEELKRRIQAENLHILFVGVDFELPILAREKYNIEKITSCKIMVSSEEVVRVGNDKYLTYKFLKDNDLHYPLTFLPHELKNEKIQFPVIIKPRVGARSVGVFKVHTLKEFDEKIKVVKEPIVQEYIGNPNTEYTCGIIYFDNELKAQISLRRSLKNGNTHVSEYQDSFPKQIQNYVREVAVKLKPYGSCNLQLRLDDRGTPKLFEINPRHSGTTYMRSLFGYNEVIFILKYVLENKVTNFSLSTGKAIRFYDEELLK